MNKPYITKKPSPPSHSVLHSHKNLPQSKHIPTLPQQQMLQRRGLLDFIPSDEALIEEYIEELQLKLQEIRQGSPKRRQPRLVTQQIFKRKQSGVKGKTKSNDGNSRSRPISQSASMPSAKKVPLLDFKHARDEFKRSKLGLAERRVAIEKENHRYSEEKTIKTQPKSQQAASADLHIRSNTEVIRSQKNPARIYRYSSLKKTPFDQGTLNNNYLFDKLISVQHNINIRLDQHSRSPKERLRREPNEEASHEKEYERRSPKKQKVKISENNNEKIGDLSTINAKKETLNFLGDSCLMLKQQLAPKQQKHVSKILDFLGWKTTEMQKALRNLKQKKRKNCMDKLGRIFPKGFFP